MNLKLSSLILSGALMCSLAVPAAAADRPANVTIAPPPNVIIAKNPNAEKLPDSVLYYGEVKEIRKDDEGVLRQLVLFSERSGREVMNLSDKTVWIDSGECKMSDAATLTVGERIYVAHSAVSTRSMPSQSTAFAVIRNLPMDSRCPAYHEVEAVAEKDGKTLITTDNGELTLVADANTGVSLYGSDETVTLADLTADTHAMVWYQEYVEHEPGQQIAFHIMLLEKAETEPEEQTVLTRGGLASLLHKQAGEPVVNFLMQYSDVSGEDAGAEAIRWVSSEKLMCGYGTGAFGAEDAVTFEQLITVLWRSARSPMLMDYPGLTKYEDVSSVSPFAIQAMLWGHQKGLVIGEGNLLKPKAPVTVQQAETILAAFRAL